ncbi:hypothetical protein [Amycolatopsis pretoriensis]|nr:hypothetical protein [Amycolatopsis pretoriensis]
MSNGDEQGVSDVGRYLGDSVVVRALEAWARDRALSLEVPDEPWRRRGGSGALLARLRITPTVEFGDSVDVILKVCSKGSPAGEARNYERAWLSSPTFASRHLIRQLFQPQTVEDGRVLMFLDSSEMVSNSQTVGEMEPAYQQLGAAEAIRSILYRWNEPTGWTRRRTSASEFLRLELRGALNRGRSAYRWADRAGLMVDDVDWFGVRIGKSGKLPNPIHLLNDDSAFSKIDVDYVLGYSHGDLHVDNIVVPLTDGQPDFGQIRLIDLSGYSSSAPLSRDVATLLLSLILPTVRAKTNSGGDMHTLVRLLIDADFSHSDLEESVIAQSVHRVRAAVIRGLDYELKRIFQIQYLLSLLAQAITYTSYSNVGEVGRQWYFAFGLEVVKKVNEMVDFKSD